MVGGGAGGKRGRRERERGACPRRCSFFSWKDLSDSVLMGRKGGGRGEGEGETGAD